MNFPGRWSKVHRSLVITIILVCAYFVFRHFFLRGGATAIAGYFSAEHASTLCLLLMLVVLNQGAELLKWKILASEVIHDLSWSKVIESQLGGFILGSVTPGRIGETAGRALLLPGEKRNALFFLSLNSSFSIFISSLLLGIIPLFHFFDNEWLRFSVISFCLVFLAAFLFPFHLKPLLTRLGIRSEVAGLFRSKTQSMVLVLSLIRVIIYSLQLSMVFHISDGFEAHDMTFVLALLYYSIITLLPSYFLSEIGVRGSGMLLIAGLSNIDYHFFIAPLTLVWAINVGIPALAGCAVMIRKFR